MLITNKISNYSKWNKMQCIFFPFHRQKLNELAKRVLITSAHSAINHSLMRREYYEHPRCLLPERAHCISDFKRNLILFDTKTLTPI